MDTNLTSDPVEMRWCIACKHCDMRDVKGLKEPCRSCLDDSTRERPNFKPDKRRMNET